MFSTILYDCTVLYYTDDVSHSFLPSQQFHNLEPNKTKKDGEEKEAATELSDNLQKRMTNAMSEIKQRHSNGTSQADDADKAPTGSAYHAAAQMKKSKENENEMGVKVHGRGHLIGVDGKIDMGLAIPRMERLLRMVNRLMTVEVGLIDQIEILLEQYEHEHATFGIEEEIGEELFDEDFDDEEIDDEDSDDDE